MNAGNQQNSRHCQCEGWHSLERKGARKRQFVDQGKVTDRSDSEKNGENKREVLHTFWTLWMSEVRKNPESAEFWYVFLSFKLRKHVVAEKDAEIVPLITMLNCCVCDVHRAFQIPNFHDDCMHWMLGFGIDFVL